MSLWCYMKRSSAHLSSLKVPAKVVHCNCFGGDAFFIMDAADEPRGVCKNLADAATIVGFINSISDVRERADSLLSLVSDMREFMLNEHRGALVYDLTNAEISRLAAIKNRIRDALSVSEVVADVHIEPCETQREANRSKGGEEIQNQVSETLAHGIANLLRRNAGK